MVIRKATSDATRYDLLESICSSRTVTLAASALQVLGVSNRANLSAPRGLAARISHTIENGVIAEQKALNRGILAPTWSSTVSTLVWQATSGYSLPNLAR